MKRLFALLALIPLLALGAANDIQISQINAAGTAAVTHLFQPASGTQFTTLAGWRTAQGIGLGDSPQFTGLTLSGLTITRIPFVSIGGLLIDSATFTFTVGTGLLAVPGVSAASFQTTSSAFNAQTGTTYTLQASDNGKLVTLSNAAAITLTVPASLGAGFSCTIIQIGAGQVTVTASSTTIRNVYSNTKLVGQWAQATLTAYIADNFIFSGDTSP